MLRALTDEQIQQVAEALIGQCSQDIDDVCNDLGLPLFSEWKPADCAVFDELAFLCSVCAWWVSGDDHAENEIDEFICSECGQEN